MGRMGDAATLAGVGLAAFIVWKLATWKPLAGLPTLPTIELPKLELPKLPPPPPRRPRGGADSDTGGNTDISDQETVYVPVITKTVTEVIPTPPIVTMGPGVESIIEGMIARKPGFYAQEERGYLDAGGGVNV